MRRKTMLTLALLITAALIATAWVAAAQQEAPPPPAPAAQMPGAPMPGATMPGMGMGMMGMCPMCSMCGAMMGRSAIAVADDAVYVLAGNRLLKYDPSLNLQKEAEIAMDMANMGQMCQMMMQNCPMMQQMGPMAPGAGGMAPGAGGMAPQRPMRRRALMSMGPMHGGMMGGVLGRSALAVADDGLYVLAGNKLLKYDRDLNLKGEAEVAMDPARMGQMMQEMMRNCPMMQGMMPGASRRQGSRAPGNAQ